MTPDIAKLVVAVSAVAVVVGALGIGQRVRRRDMICLGCQDGDHSHVVSGRCVTHWCRCEVQETPCTCTHAEDTHTALNGCEAKDCGCEGRPA